MPCWLENHGAAINTLDRKLSWHRDCPYPNTCPCPRHEENREEPESTSLP